MTKLKNMKLIEKYFRMQSFIDIGWAEFSWFNDSLVEMMAVIYILEKLGVVIEGTTVYWILIGAFVFFWGFGKFLKRSGVYDRALYVDAELDPVTMELLKAARKINANGFAQKETYHELEKEPLHKNN